MSEYTIKGLREYARKVREGNENTTILVLADDDKDMACYVNGQGVELAASLAVLCRSTEGMEAVLEHALDAYRNVPIKE